jgi:uncharacterized protein (TIGR00730 family)
MTNDQTHSKLFHSAADELAHAKLDKTTLQTRSPAYRLAYDDLDFVLRDDMRSVRLLMELGKTDLGLQDHGIEKTVVVFGSARISDPAKAELAYEQLERTLQKSPHDRSLAEAVRKARKLKEYAHYYQKARELCQLIAAESGCSKTPALHIMTGGGPGTMEAANRGATDAGCATVGLNIVLPEEQAPNIFVTPSLCFRFHYFAMRKMHFLLRARALIIFPGGFGTLDELFETLTLVQTKKIKPLPILLFGQHYWERLIDFNFLVEEGMIADNDLDSFRYVENIEDAWQMLQNYFSNNAWQAQPKKSK